jgi:acetyl-CoA acyltransferase
MPRPVIVAGLRTPFARSGTVLADATAVELARRAVQELLHRTQLPGTEVNEVVFGQVISSVLAPNVAREVSLLPQLPRNVPAFSLNRACASAGQAISYAADQIVLGHAGVIIAGGVESLSDIPILHSRRMSRILVEASKARSPGQRIRTFLKVRPRDLVPVAPAIAEPSTGESMGQSAEKMAKENRISREEQDRIALMSHQRAAAATASGRLTREIAPWFSGPAMDR